MGSGFRFFCYWGSERVGCPVGVTHTTGPQCKDSMTHMTVAGSKLEGGGVGIAIQESSY